MSRPLPIGLAVLLALVLAEKNSQAQFAPYGSFPGSAYSWGAPYGWGGYGGAGSTVQGDIDRGLGFFAMGLGYFNLNTAIAHAIESDRIQRECVFIEQSVREQARSNQARRERRVRETTVALNNNQVRLTQWPEESDVLRGSALNALLRKIADRTAASPSSLRSAPVPVPGGSVEKAPMMLPSAGVTISGARLTERREWPLLLRGKAFDERFRAYEKAIELALESLEPGSVQSDRVARVDQALQDLQRGLAGLPNGEPSIDAQEARTFLRELSQAVKFLHVARAGNVLAEMMSYGGTTVGELVEFMSRSRLQFGPAATPSERALYRTLYPLLARQWELLDPKAVPQPDQG